ncbi:MAG TPA: CPBP family intramembrane glutamic endopeptidase [Chlamydiales bacterium]|nr:CPBP family intramembrane glutamic endopeptidase [Chlamydiales bacterium]
MSKLVSVALFGVVAVFFLYFAKRSHYFSFPKVELKWRFPIRWFHVASVFAIYLVCVTFLTPLITRVLGSILRFSPPIANIAWLNFLISLIILACISGYSALISREIAWKIWRRDEQNSLWKDMKFAALSFAIAFPLVIFSSELFDLLLYYIFQVPVLPDQLAVRFLKMTFQYPRYFFLSVATIIVFAPMLEEAIFRGFLQSFIRQKLGAKMAILITSLFFAFFHYSPDQGLANISIIGSLFVFALFLGFVYEKQGSLTSSIGLHALFNSFSVLNLYFLGELYG